LTYDGGDYTGSPQELANALKPAKRAAMPKPTPSQLAQRTTAPKAVAVEPPPTPTAAVAAADDGELTASGRRIRRAPVKLVAATQGGAQLATHPQRKPAKAAPAAPAAQKKRPAAEAAGTGSTAASKPSKRAAAAVRRDARVSEMQSATPHAAKLAADESVAHVHTPAAAAPAVEHAPPTTSREDALLSALDMSLDDVVRGLDSFCATI
jgi:hypothetical protein